MGDIIHALPGAASLRQSFPGAHITWVVEPKWGPLLEGNGLVNRVVRFHRGQPGTWTRTRRELRERHYDLAVDFQGLLKSALVAHFAAPERIVGFAPGVVRERAASWFYSTRVRAGTAHVVDQGLELSQTAAGRKNTGAGLTFALPAGAPEGTLPDGPFALASPLAGWTSKQWPLDYYEQLAGMLRTRLHMPLVFNGAPGTLPEVAWALRHESGIPGLIDATRRAAFVVGVDSGPLHLAAALGKPGVAIFGPTDPARNGPRGGDFQVFRAQGVRTTHRRGTEIDAAMLAVRPEQVFAALAARMGCQV